MKNTCTFIISIFILSLSACSEDSKPPALGEAKHLFAKHYVRYLQTEKELKAEVYFKEGDTMNTARSIVLNNVIFEDNVMEAQNLGNKHGLRYSFRKRGPYSKEYEFKYNHKQHGYLSHILKIEPVTAFKIKEGMIRKKTGMTISWEGAALNDDQQMILFFTDEAKKAFPITMKGPTQQNEVFVPAFKLEGLSLGKGQLMLVKKQFSKSEKNGVTYLSEIEFYSNNLDIEVVE